MFDNRWAESWPLRIGIAALICFACFYTGPVVDGDYFWHVHTGQWIAEHGELPQGDPFTYTGAGYDKYVFALISGSKLKTDF